MKNIKFLKDSYACTVYWFLRFLVFFPINFSFKLCGNGCHLEFAISANHFKYQMNTTTKSLLYTMYIGFNQYCRLVFTKHKLYKGTLQLEFKHISSF